jgi:transcriptional regulator with XRE-family HTH domain
MNTLEHTRKLLKISQAQLADASGVKKSAISDIETGRVLPENVSHGTVVRLVRALQRLGIPGLDSDALFPVQDKVA